MPDADAGWIEIREAWQEWAWYIRTFEFDEQMDDGQENLHEYDDSYTYQGSWTDFFP